MLETIRQFGREQLLARGELEIASGDTPSSSQLRYAWPAGDCEVMTSSCGWTGSNESSTIWRRVARALEVGDVDLALSLFAPLYVVPYIFSPKGREIEIGLWAVAALELPDASATLPVW